MFTCLRSEVLAFSIAVASLPSTVIAEESRYALFVNVHGRITPYLSTMSQACTAGTAWMNAQQISGGGAERSYRLTMCVDQAGIAAQWDCSIPSDGGQFCGSEAARFKAPLIEVDRSGELPRSCPWGNPIYPLQGNKVEAVSTGLFVGELEWKITFDNREQSTGSSTGALGRKWFSNLHRSLLLQGGGTAYARGLTASRGDGTNSFFFGSGGGAGAFAAPLEGKDRLTSLDRGYGGYQYIDTKTSAEEVYDTNGQLTGIHWAAGGSTIFTYSTASTSPAIAPGPDYLLTAADSLGRSIGFEYNSSGQIARASTPWGAKVTLGYDTSGRLINIAWPDGTAKRFVYEAGDDNLTGVIDELLARYATFGYDALGNATSTEHALGAERLTVSFTQPPTKASTEEIACINGNCDLYGAVIYRYWDWQAPIGTVLTNPNGTTSALGPELINGKIFQSTLSQPAGSGCAAAIRSMAYDGNGNVLRSDDFKGNRTCLAHDLSRNLETVRVEGLAGTTDCAAVVPPSAAVPTAARRITTQWHSDWQLPTKRSEPGKITTWVYNGQPDPFNGNLIASCAPANALLPDAKPIVTLCKRVEQATDDADGGKGLGLTGYGVVQPDPHASNVVLQLEMNGANNGTVFTDASSKNQVPFSVVAPAVTDTASARNGSAAANFTGGYLWYANSADFDMGASDFTVEAWLKFNSASIGQRSWVFGKASSNGASATIQVGKLSSDKLQAAWTTSNGSSAITDVTALEPNVWYHVALERSGGSMTFWKNGTVIATTSVSGSFVPNMFKFGVGVLGEYTYAYGGTYGTRMMGWIDDLRLTKGIARFAAMSPGSSGTSPRVWTYTYNQGGQTLSEDGPRTDVSDIAAYGYYTDTTAEHTIGDLQTITNAVGKVTTYTKYNKAGKWLEMSDPNGVLTVNTYDLRQRLLSTSVGGQKSVYSYDPVGQLTRVTRPDSSYIGYEYDAAHRQIAVFDNLGNRIEYTLDNDGNRTAETVKDPGGVLKRQLSRSIDALGRVQQTTGRQ